MDALVRRAVPDDAETIAAVHIQTWQTAYRGQIPDRYLDDLVQQLDHRTEFWRTEIATPRTNRHEIWVVASERKVDGFAAIGPALDELHNAGELYAIYVSPERWGQGLGRTLFTHATNRLGALGYSAAILWVLESNTRARRFYEIAGWSFDGETKVESRPDGIELREVRYKIGFDRESKE